MTKKSKIAIGIIVIILIGVYLSNPLAKFGLCRPGTQLAQNMNGKKLCYPPISYGYKACDKKTDCKRDDNEKCLLVNENRKIGKGICSNSDSYIKLIDKDGRLTPIQEIYNDGSIWPTVIMQDPPNLYSN